MNKGYSAKSNNNEPSIALKNPNTIKVIYRTLSLRRTFSQILSFLLIAGLAMISAVAKAQPAAMYINQDIGGTYANSQMVSSGGYFSLRFQENSSGTSSGTRNWQFNSDNYYNTWGATASGKVIAASSYNTLIQPSGSTASANWVGNSSYNTNQHLGVTQANYYYTYNIIKGSSYASQNMAVMETSFNPVALNSLAQSAGTYGSDKITITTGGSPNAAEYIYIRYSTNSYATSGLVQATGSGTTWTANIPWQSGAVSFYAFSSNKTLAQINADVTTYATQDVYDLYALWLLNNSGSNYSWTPATGAVIVSSTGGTFATPIGYTSLTNASGAFAAINSAASGTGVISVLITADVITEAGTNALNSSANWTSLSINPNGIRTISAGASGIALPMITLNGAKNVTIDGLNTGGNSLKISNASTSITAGTCTIKFIGDATTNTIQNCTITGSSTAPIGGGTGVIWFSTGTTGGITGTINNNTITAEGSNLPLYLIYSLGSSSYSNTVTVSNNNFADWAITSASTNGAIYVDGTGNTAWSITGNKIYQTASRAGGASTSYGIYIGTGNSNTVSTNTIGYSASAGTGTLTVTSGGTSRFVGISLGVLTTTATEVQGNTITAINFATTSAASAVPGIFSGIYVTAGKVNIGQTTANIIGASSGTGSIITTSSTTAATTYGIAATSTSTVTISGNTIGSISALGTTASIATTFYGIRTAGTAGIFTINSNTIGNSTANNIVAGVNGTTTGGTNVWGIYMSNTGTITSNFNNIQNLNNNGSGSGQLEGIYAVGGSSETIQGNTILSLTNLSINTYVAGIAGIEADVNATGEIISGNIIGGLSSSSTSSSSGQGVAGIFIYGGGVSTPSSCSIYQNKIYGITNSGTKSGYPAIYGIYYDQIGTASSGSGYTTYNNMISLTNGNNTNGVYIYGLYEQDGNAGSYCLCNYFFNSINIGGASGGSNSYSYYRYPYAYYSTVSFKNNILNNIRTGTGTQYAIYNADASGGSLTSDYNVLNAGTIGNVSGTTESTLANWQSASGGDNHSYSGITCTFLSPSTGDLHMNMGTTPTHIESGGVTGTGITTDYDAQVRPGPSGSANGGASAPDIGADEFDGVPLDQTPPIISYSNLTSTTSTSNRSTSSFATITDASGVNTTTGTKPRLYYKKSGDANSLFGNTSATGGWKYVESSSSTSPFDFTIDYGLLNAGSVSSGDVIQYFVVAQDNAATPNVAINSGTFAATPASVVLTSAAFPITGTINSYNITYSFSGAVSVGTGQTFTSLTNAGGIFAAINQGTVVGNVTINITSDLTSEAGTNALNAFASPYTITIQPSGAARAVSGSLSSNGLIRLNGASRVTINGSVGGAGTDKSLTITNTSTTSPTAISLISLGTSAGAASNTIKNCNISTGVYTGSSYGIAIGGSTPGTSGADNDKDSIQNNAITVATIGVYANGTAAVSAGGDDNLGISGNTVTVSSSASTTIYGIEAGNSLSSSINGNTISSTTSGGGQPVGISLETGFVSSTVSQNKITGIVTTNTGGYGSRGITVGTGASSSALTIANNVIYGVNGSNFSSFTNSSSIGIGIGMVGNSGTLTTTAGGINLYYNSVNMYGNYSYATSCLTAGLYVGSGASTLDIRDNILVNSMNNTSASGTGSKNYAIYSAAANTAFSANSFNNNDYFVSGSQGVLGNIGGSDDTNIGALRTAFGQNVNSIALDPLFTSSTNLLPSTASAPEVGAAVTISTITTDINGTIRNSSPTMGAYELTPCTPPTLTAGSNTPVCSGGTLSLTATSNGTSFSWTGPNSYTSTTQNPSITNVTTAAAGTYTVTAMLAGCPATQTTAVIVNTPPTAVTVTPGTGAICAGTVQQLTASGGTTTGNVTVLTENFNSGASTWTKVNSSTGGTNAALAAWTAQSDGLSYNSETFHSNDNSTFFMSNSDAQGSGGTTKTTLTSPAFNTVGFTSLNLSFYQYFKYWSSATNDSATVQASLDNTNWTTLQKYSGANQGAAAAFANPTIALTSPFLNQSTVYVRFLYTSTFGYYWAIDNVTLSGVGPVQAAITWTPTTPTNTIYTNAGATTNYTTGNNALSVYVKPTNATSSQTQMTYTATATANGCTATNTSVLTVNPVPSIPNQTAMITSGQTFTVTPSDGSNGAVVPSNTTYAWGSPSQTNTSGGAASTGTPTSISGTLNATAATAGSAVYTVTPTGGSTLGSCAGSSFTTTVTVNPFSIIATAGANGSISPSGTTYVASGGSQTYTITPNTGYSISGVLVDGSSVGPVSSYTFSSVTANHTITASFSVNTYTLAASASPSAGGTVSAPSSATYNTATNISATANTGYSFNNWTVISGSATFGNSTSASTTVTLTANSTIQANFTINTYTITSSAGANGSINPNGSTQVNYGASQTYTITPNTGYLIATVLVDGTNNTGAVNSGSYTFTNVTATHSISATFVVNVATADYQTQSDGNFSVASNWQYNNGSGWVTATVPPTSTNNVKIQNNIILDQNFINGGGTTFNIAAIPLNATDSLTVAPGITLTIAGTANFHGNSVTLKSDATGTASLGTVTGTLAGASNVTAERYIPVNTASGRTGKAWRLVTSAVTGTTINAAWQEGKTWDGISADSAAANPNAGYGTLITGQQQGNATAANNIGYDFWSAVSNSYSSIQRYRQGAPYGSWAVLPSGTKTATTLNTDSAYLVYIRGDRSVSTGTATATTLRATGTLYTGTKSIQIKDSLTAGFTLIGNPYASAIDYEKIYTDATNSNTIKSSFYIWDANLNTLGGYVLATRNAANSYTVTPSGGTVSGSTVQYIQSGQAFFAIPATAAISSLSITESDKATGSNNLMMLGNGGEDKKASITTIDMNLKLMNADSSLLEADGALVKFSSGTAKQVNALSISKAYNFSENLSLYSGNSYLIVGGYSLPKAGDTVHLKLWGTSQRSYQFTFKAANASSLDVKAYLSDKYTGKLTDINLAGKTTTINFSITSDAASQSIDRFCIVFKKDKTQTITDNTSSTEDKNIVEMKAYPNPVQGENFTLSVNNLAAGRYTISLYSPEGKMLQTQEADHKGGALSQSVNIPKGWVNGQYQVSISNEKGEIIKTVPVILGRF